MMPRSPALLLIAAIALLDACAIHSIDIQQGNIITPDMISQLEVGMSKKQVRFVMGTPLITDAFHTNRWDYVYTFKAGKGESEQRRVSLYFEGDRLVRIEGNVPPAASESSAQP